VTIDTILMLTLNPKRLQQSRESGRSYSATLLAYVPELGKIESAQLSALIGVAPYPKDSRDDARTPVTSEEVGRRYATFLYMASRTPLLVPIDPRGFFINACSPTANPLSLSHRRHAQMVCLMNRAHQRPRFLCLPENTAALREVIY